LGRLTDEEEFEPYLDAAEERLNEGLSETKGDVYHKIQLALAKIWLAKAASAVSEGDQTIPELSTRALDTLDKVIDESEVSTNTIVELADIVQNHGDLYESLESRDKFRNWAENALENVLKEEPANVGALSELGLCKLSLANYYLDNLDDDEDDEEEKTKLTEDEEKAYQAILSSKKYFELAKEISVKTNDVSPQVLSDLAETLLNEANLVLKEEEQAEIYKKAIENIKEANALIEEKKLDFILPEALTSFLEEFEE
jgi:tetratricopeptide (TPR) repeat protein